MWNSFRCWLNSAPIGDPIERRQAPMLQVMLIGIVIAATLALVNIQFAPVTTGRRLLGIAVNTFYIVCGASGLVAMRRGHFRLSALIPTIGSALILGLFLIAVGLRNGAPFMIVFAIPITLAGLLTGRPISLLVIGIGVATMLVMLILERVAPALTGFVPVGDSTSTIAVVFILVTSLVGLFLDRFGHTLSATLTEALARERELEQSRAALEARTGQLEREIGERKHTELALHRSTERLRILAQASRVFAEAGAEGSMLFERIARTIAESLHDYCGIRMLSADGQWLTTVALHNAAAEPLDPLQTAMVAAPVPVAAIPSLWQTMQGDQALLMPPLDPTQIRAAFPLEVQPDMRQLNDYDRVVAPLRINGQPIGVIGVTHKRSSGSPYGEDDLRLVQDLADRAAMAISNAQLYQQLQQSHTALEARVAARTTELADANATLQRQAEQAGALATMSRALAEAGRDLQPLFDTIAQHVARLIGDTCVLFVLSADRQWIQPVAAHNADANRNALIHRLLAGAPNRADVGWSAPIVATGQPLLLPHISAADMRAQLDPRYHAYLETVDALSLLIVPLRAHGTLLGMLMALRDRPDRPYGEDDQALLQDLADRAGLAIENARLFAEVEQARNEAERASTAKDAFLASMSHELRTPLNAILGFTGTLLMKLPGPLTAEQEKQLTTVQRSGKHLLNLINDILDLAKIESGRVELRSERVVCQAVIDEVLTALRPSAEQKGLRCAVVAPVEPIIIASDQRVLSQILINLVNNAIKFTDHGEVVVSLGRQTKDERPRTKEGSDETLVLGASSFVTFTVRDTGMGIADEDQAKLFQEFGRVNSDAVRAREGTGLGLRLSRRLAELLGGTITLTSELGSGSTFTLALPAVSQQC
jgi:signal transduction histidine kinase